MPRTKSLQLENERREQLLFATYTVFARQGFAETSLADIAAAADFSMMAFLQFSIWAMEEPSTKVPLSRLPSARRSSP